MVLRAETRPVQGHNLAEFLCTIRLRRNTRPRHQTPPQKPRTPGMFVEDVIEDSEDTKAIRQLRTVRLLIMSVGKIGHVFPIDHVLSTICALAIS